MAGSEFSVLLAQRSFKRTDALAFAVTRMCILLSPATFEDRLGAPQLNYSLYYYAESSTFIVFRPRYNFNINLNKE